jgi:KaiC/GvpD/RAD55 family RecA-like ATPase
MLNSYTAVSMGRLPSTGVPALDEMLGGVGYPQRSAILVVGPPGVGKEAISYMFAQSGLQSGDFCLYVTKLSVDEILQDQRALRMEGIGGTQAWIAREGGQADLNIKDPQGLLNQVKHLLDENVGRKARVVTDILSPLLMLNPLETAYQLVGELLAEIKKHDAVLLATLEEGMHPAQAYVAMQELFDGFLEMSLYRAGFRLLPLLRVGKMRGANPSQGYYVYSFTQTGMSLQPAYGGELEPSAAIPQGGNPPSGRPAPLPIMGGIEARTVFNYLAKSFMEDFTANKLAIEQSGWRSRTNIAKATGSTKASLYGEQGRFGPTLKELISSGLVETRFFPGERGRGGEIIKVRVAYEKELVKRLVNGAAHERGAVS